MIRVAESERDVARWLEIRNAVFPAIAMTAAALTEADRRGPPGRRKLLADEGGFAIAMPTDFETPEPWLTVGVLPEVRRRGIGAALWTGGAAHLASLGITTVRSLSMDGDADGARFLRRRGSRDRRPPQGPRARPHRTAPAGAPAAAGDRRA